jgi:hypothetical protein
VRHVLDYFTRCGQAIRSLSNCLDPYTTDTAPSVRKVTSKFGNADLRKDRLLVFLTELDPLALRPLKSRDQGQIQGYCG